MTARQGFVLTLGIFLCAARFPAASAQVSRGGVTPGAAPQAKVALLVAIGTYSPESGWHDLNTSRDVELLSAALKHHGFASIEVVRDASATRTGIIAAIERLTRRAGPGSVALFHYSGHGQRITDDGDDEIDGYDETLVAYDAPRRPPTTYRGERHVRDDELYRLLEALRRKVGPRGNVVVSLDSCHSGSGARGPGAPPDSVIRGGAAPIGAPRKRPVGSAGSDLGSGFGDGATASGTASAAAPYVVLSAARHDEVAYETRDDAGRGVGSLSLALSTALLKAGPASTYRDLFADIRSIMAGQVRNRPQAEGTIDTLLFSGQAVAQAPYFEVEKVHDGARRVTLKGGTLVGLRTGSVVEVHRHGTRKPGDASLLASGRVETATAVTADIVLEAPATGLVDGWAFVTRASFGELRVRVRVDDGGASWGAGLRAALARESLIEVHAEGAHVVVAERKARPGFEGGVVAQSALDGTLLAGPFAGSKPDLSRRIAGRLRDFAKNRYLRRLKLSRPEVDVRLEILPCECADAKCRQCVEVDPTTLETAGHQVELTVGERFRVKLTNVGSAGAYVSILDLMPDGQVGLLWPALGHGPADAFLAAGESFTVPTKPSSYRVTPPLGLDVLKVFATQEPVDFAAITTGGTRSTPPGHLDALFADALSGTRGSPVLPRDAVSTYDLTLSVVER